MRALDIMTTPPVSVHPSTSVRDAIALLSERGYAGLPVVDDDGRVVGIFTEADALNYGMDASGELRVDAMMSTPVEVANAETHVTELARRMLADGLRCMPVVTDGVLVGVISRHDLLRPLVRSDDTIATHVRALLDDYSGKRDGWHVTVSGGAVTISGAFADEAERAVAAALARTVLGVTTVETNFATSGVTS
ncbi:HPP family protein [Haloechinothrix salitolerans]|uniref:HPP family protein n=1 Tax=Haloechinothrix salitolerans TaxID=926830 RepID=A0ABW2BYH2_9PSEU